MNIPAENMRISGASLNVLFFQGDPCNRWSRFLQLVSIWKLGSLDMTAMIKLHGIDGLLSAIPSWDPPKKTIHRLWPVHAVKTKS